MIYDNFGKALLFYHFEILFFLSFYFDVKL